MKRDVRILINTLHSSSPRRKCNCRMNEHLGVFATELRAKSKFVHGLLEVKLSECIIHGQTLTECKNRRNSIRIQLSAWSSTSSTQDKTTLNQIRRTNCFSWRYLTSQCLLDKAAEDIPTNPQKVAATLRPVSYCYEPAKSQTCKYLLAGKDGWAYHHTI